MCLAKPSGSHGGKVAMSIWRILGIARFGMMGCRTWKGLWKVMERLWKVIERLWKVMNRWKGLQLLQKGAEHSVVGGIVGNP
jgi:hypothetical protein